MTMEELREALKVMDQELVTLRAKHPKVQLQALSDAFADLSEYLIKSHARIDRLSANVSKLMKKLDVKP